MTKLKNPKHTGVFFKSGSYWYQRRTPTRLVPYVGRKNLMVNLQTKCLDIATTRLDAAKDEVNEIMQAAQSAYDRGDPPKSHRDPIVVLCEQVADGSLEPLVAAKMIRAIK